MGRRQILVLGNAILEMEIAARRWLSLVGGQDAAPTRAAAASAGYATTTPSGSARPSSAGRFSRVSTSA